MSGTWLLFSFCTKEKRRLCSGGEKGEEHRWGERPAKRWFHYCCLEYYGSMQIRIIWSRWNIYVTDWRMNLNRKEGWGDRHCGNWYPLTFVSSIFFSMKRSGAWMRERNFRSVRKRLPTRSSPAATSRYIVWTTDCFRIRRYACCMTAYYFRPAWTMDVPVGFWTN